VNLPDGSKIRISGTPEIDTKVAAELAERDHIARVREPQQPRKEVPLFGAFADEFLATYAEINNKPSEVQTKRQTFTHHVKPMFGKLRLDRIGPREIEGYKSEKIRAGYSPKTVNNHLIVLRKLLAVAVEWQMLDRVPRMKWLKVPKPDFDFLTFLEADRLESAAAGEGQVGAMISLARHTGLRQGELLGLQWRDVDLKIGVLTVRRACVRGVLVTPKSGRTRDIPLNAIATSLLTELPRSAIWVFPGPDGNPLPRGQCKWPLYRACREAGLRQIGWHVLRHTFASHLVMRGAQLKVIQELLGHATIEMTMRYAHLSPDVRKDAVRLLEMTRDKVPTERQQEQAASYN
jgi:integrase